MAEIKIYGTLISATADKAIAENNQIIGGFMTLTANERDSLPTSLKKIGMTIYCSTDNKYYKLNSSNIWEEAYIAGDGIDINNTTIAVKCGDGLKIDEAGKVSLDLSNFTGGEF